MVEVVTLNAIELLGGVEEGGAATNDNTFLRGSSSGAESVLDAVLELADLDLGSTADLDNGNATSESSHALLELLTVVLACRVFHGSSDSVNTLLDILSGAGATHEDSVILGDDDLLGSAEHGDVSAVEALTNILREEGSTSGDSNILHGVTSIITEAWGLDTGDLESTAELVDHECGESLRLNILSNDKEWLLGLHAGLEEGEDLLDGADLLVNEEHGSVSELDLGGLGLGHEVGRDISTVPLETLNVLDLSLETLALGHSDGAVGSESVEDASNEATDMGVVVGRDGSDVPDLFNTVDRDRLVSEALNDLLDSHLNATSQIHWVHAGGDRFAALLEDGTSENGGGRGAITGLIVGLAGNLLDEVGTDVVVAIAELDVLGNSDTILSDLGSAKSSVEDDIATAGSESDLDSVSEHIAALKHESAGFSTEFDILTGEIHTLGGDETIASGQKLALALLESLFEDSLHHLIDFQWIE